MTGPFTAACVQFTAGPDIEPNLRQVADLIRRARDAGADFIMTPEVSNLIESGRRRREKARREGEEPFLAGMRELARQTGAWLLLGSLVIDPSREPGAEAGEGRLANRSFLIDSGGAIVTRYDKIHMFDIDLPGGESYRESNAYRPGRHTVVAETPWGRLGMSVCYDVRFPHLYRALAQAGADFLAVPSVFTVPTGQAHWHVLLRARAIENGCFVFAPGAMGRARRRAQELRPFADRRSVGRGPGRWRRGDRDRHGADRPGAGRRGAAFGAITDARSCLYAAGSGFPFAGRRVASPLDHRRGSSRLSWAAGPSRHRAAVPAPFA